MHALYCKSRFFQTKAKLYLNAKISVQTQALNVLGVDDLLQNSLLCNIFNCVSFFCFYSMLKVGTSSHCFTFCPL
jgi:hypothetical protein